MSMRERFMADVIHAADSHAANRGGEADSRGRTAREAQRHGQAARQIGALLLQYYGHIQETAQTVEVAPYVVGKRGPIRGMLGREFGDSLGLLQPGAYRMYGVGFWRLRPSWDGEAGSQPVYRRFPVALGEHELAVRLTPVRDFRDFPLGRFLFEDGRLGTGCDVSRGRQFSLSPGREGSAEDCALKNWMRPETNPDGRVPVVRVGGQSVDALSAADLPMMMAAAQRLLPASVMLPEA